nr:hypothetical protein [Tanacetum cinerariifolium]
MKDRNKIYKVKDIQLNLALEWNIDISYKCGWGVKRSALNMLNDSHHDSFSQLPYYCHNLKLENEGSITHILTDEQGRFEMLFVRFSFAIQNSIRYLWPLIIINAAHLKGSNKGTNLVAVGMDGKNQILPIAMGVTQGEIGASWTWFMNRLKDCIGKKIRGIFWKTCKAYTTHELDSLLDVLRGYRLDGAQKLEIAGFEKWSREYCPVNRYNYMTSNSVESGEPWFINITLKDTYREFVYPLKDVPTWEATIDLQHVLPPVMVKQPAGRLKNTNRVLSKGEAPSLNRCTRQKRMSNKTHITREHLTAEALLDEERARNGRIYQDWYDLEA